MSLYSGMIDMVSLLFKGDGDERRLNVADVFDDGGDGSDAAEDW